MLVWVTMDVDVAFAWTVLTLVLVRTEGQEHWLLLLASTFASTSRWARAAAALLDVGAKPVTVVNSIVGL